MLRPRRIGILPSRTQGCGGLTSSPSCNFRAEQMREVHVQIGDAEERRRKPRRPDAVERGDGEGRQGRQHEEPVLQSIIALAVATQRRITAPAIATSATPAPKVIDGRWTWQRFRSRRSRPSEPHPLGAKVPVRTVPGPARPRHQLRSRWSCRLGLADGQSKGKTISGVASMV